MSNLLLKVEAMPGTSIDDACQELSDLSKRVGATVEADFNGVKVAATPKSEPKKLVDGYHQVLNGGPRFKFVID